MRMLGVIPALPVTDIVKSGDFYHDKLGYTLVYHEEGFAIVECNHIQIHLWVANDESWRTRNVLSPIVSGAESFLAGTTSCRISVEDIDELYQRIQPLGILPSNGHLRDQPWGDRDFSVLDPDNNLI
ncbi:bleomycin resistance protein [Brevibacillus laterosporus]|uniref:bleomycin resistance protein n=1 Tax=Brevibacillus laterosporus TaxID=1465 RepID=UPI000B9B6AE7|nr:VOC family protein [Brevibacillus laterosporus]